MLDKRRKELDEKSVSKRLFVKDRLALEPVFINSGNKGWLHFGRIIKVLRNQSVET